jgi:hypothetical protein
MTPPAESDRLRAEYAWLDLLVRAERLPDGGLSPRGQMFQIAADHARRQLRELGRGGEEGELIHTTPTEDSR